MDEGTARKSALRLIFLGLGMMLFALLLQLMKFDSSPQERHGMITFPQGSIDFIAAQPKAVIHLFIDPQCASCNDALDSIPQYLEYGFSVKLFAFPVKQNSRELSNRIWCAPNPKEALQLKSNSKWRDEPRSGPGECTIVDEHINIAKRFGMFATPTYIIDYLSPRIGYVSPQELAFQLDQALSALPRIPGSATRETVTP